MNSILSKLDVREHCLSFFLLATNIIPPPFLLQYLNFVAVKERKLQCCRKVRFRPIQGTLKRSFWDLVLLASCPEPRQVQASSPDHPVQVRLSSLCSLATHVLLDYAVTQFNMCRSSWEINLSNHILADSDLNSFEEDTRDENEPVEEEFDDLVYFEDLLNEIVSKRGRIKRSVASEKRDKIPTVEKVV